MPDIQLALSAAALTCALTGCINTPVVQWQRRLSQAELDAVIAVEQARRQQIVELSDPQQPAPVFGPLPTANTTTRAVYTCGVHGISLDLAAHVHAADCTAPDPAHLPACGCTPESISAVTGPVDVPTTTLATGWVVPTSATA